MKRIEVTLLGLWTALAALAWAFLSLASEVREGEVTAFDRWFLLALRQPGDPHAPIGPTWLTECMRDLTALGGFSLLLAFAAISIVFLVIHGRRWEALTLAVTMVLAQLSSEAFKSLYARPRPDFAIYGDTLLSQSFPSGHSTAATATYFVLATIVSTMETNIATRVFVFAVAASVVIAVGCSRVYLGVHWPSDVLAGWFLGGSWALLASLALRRPHVRGQ